MKKYLFLVLAALAIMSCKDSLNGGDLNFYFDNPQPVNDSELSELPSGFRGKYASGDKGRLVISNMAIYNENDFSETIHKSELDSVGGFYKNGKIYLKTGEIFNVAAKKDSLVMTGVLRDTIFRLSPTQKAKRINGNLVLSTKDSIFWKANIILLQRDSLKFKHLSTQQDYIAVQPLVKNLKATTDTVFVHINPTRAEFRKILKLKKLGWEKGYKKIRS